MDHRQETLELLATISDRPAEGLTDGLHLVADLGIDSPKALRLLVELEDRLDVEIEDEEAASLKTVGDVLAFVQRAAQ
jgi:acyl carrier protein